MSIMRKQNKRQEGNFSIVDNAFLQHPHMSLKSKGLLGYLLSKPDNWEIHVKQLVNVLPEGKEAIYSSIRELMFYGFISKTERRFSNGRVAGIVYDVYEESLLAQDSQPLPENPNTENPPLINTEYNNKKNNSYLKQKESIKMHENFLQFTKIIPQNKQTETVTLFPCVKKPSSKAKAVLKHCITDKLEVELRIGEVLTKSQDRVVCDVANYFACKGGESELKEWLSESLLNQKAFTGCKDFIHKLNAIIGKLRTTSYTRPYNVRYKRGIEKPIQKRLSPRPHVKAYDQAVQKERVESLEEQISRVMHRIRSSNDAERSLLEDYAQNLNMRLEEIGYLNREMKG